MAIKSNRVSTPHLKDEVDEDKKQPYNYSEIRIQSLVDARLEYDGKVSKRHYIWSKAGDVVNVLQEDVPELLSKHIGEKSCCGQNPNEGNRVFQELH